MDTEKIQAGQDFLEHHGVKGMKWGVRRSPEQLGHRKDKRAAKKKAKSQERARKAIEKAKKAKMRDLQRQQRKTAKQEKKVEITREQLLKSRNPKVLYKNVTKLSDEELRNRLNRLEMESKLKKLATSQKSEGEAIVDSIIKWGNKANDLYKLTQTELGKTLIEKASEDTSQRSKQPKQPKETNDKNKGQKK